MKKYKRLTIINEKIGWTITNSRKVTIQDLIDRLAFFEDKEEKTENIIIELRKFVDEESAFVPDISSDKLLDRLVEKINSLEADNE